MPDDNSTLKCREYPQLEQPRGRLLIVAETFWTQLFPARGSVTSFTIPAFAHVWDIYVMIHSNNICVLMRENVRNARCEASSFTKS